MHKTTICHSFVSRLALSVTP